jgi:hypothetical protein
MSSWNSEGRFEQTLFVDPVVGADINVGIDWGGIGDQALLNGEYRWV